MAFYDPGRKATLIRSNSKRSTLSSARSSSRHKHKKLNNLHEKSLSPTDFRKTDPFDMLYEAHKKTRHYKKPRSARRRRLSIDADGDKKETERSNSKRKFTTRLPEKALRSTFHIKS